LASIYNVQFVGYMNPTAATVGALLEVFQNGSAVSSSLAGVSASSAGSATNVSTISNSVIVSCNVGDTIQLFGQSTTGTVNLDGTVSGISVGMTISAVGTVGVAGLAGVTGVTGLTGAE